MTEVLFEGVEGIAAYGSDDDEIAFMLDVGMGVEGGTLYPDGTLDSVIGGTDTPPGGPIKVAWSEVKTWTPEEAEPYKAFLRSKGVTLPHVMK